MPAPFIVLKPVFQNGPVNGKTNTFLLTPESQNNFQCPIPISNVQVRYPAILIFLKPLERSDTSLGHWIFPVGY
jgi:hypothetical protein